MISVFFSAFCVFLVARRSFPMCQLKQLFSQNCPFVEVAVRRHLFFYFNLGPIVVKTGTRYSFDVSCDPMEIERCKWYQS